MGFESACPDGAPPPPPPPGARRTPPRRPSIPPADPPVSSGRLGSARCSPKSSATTPARVGPAADMRQRDALRPQNGCSAGRPGVNTSSTPPMARRHRLDHVGSTILAAPNLGGEPSASSARAPRSVPRVSGSPARAAALSGPPDLSAFPALNASDVRPARQPSHAETEFERHQPARHPLDATPGR